MLDLHDYRLRVFAMYTKIRALGTDSTAAYDLFKSTRDDLFGNHSQSALKDEDRANFTGLRYYAYNPAYRVVATLDTEVEPDSYEIDAGNDGTVTIRQFGHVHFDLPTGSGDLGVFWVEGYGGGIFIPFRDATNGKTSYGGGRYLYDSIKGADLGVVDGSMVLDFNYAYHPSCYYNERWVCPLAPMQNRLNFAIEAGEQYMTDKE